MKTKQGILNTIYISNNEQFSSLSKYNVEKWNNKELEVSSLDKYERHLWQCKGYLIK